MRWLQTFQHHVCRRLPFILLSVATVSVLIWVGTVQVASHGDSTEYFFQAYQFSRKLELSGTKEDLHRFAEWLSPAKKLYFDIEDVPEYPRGCGFTRVGDRYLAVHFGSYSALAALPSVVLRLLALDERRALLWTNALLFAAMLWGVWFLLPYRDGTKTAVVACSVFSPILPYLAWVHAEVYLFAFLMLSLAAAVAGKRKLSLLFAGVASMQNQTLALYLLALFGLFVRSEWVFWRQNRRVRWGEWGGVFLAGLPSLVPIVYYLVRLHKPTLLGGMTVVSSSCMSLGRAWSLFADLNQGMVVASSAVVVLFFFFVIRGVVTGRFEQAWMAVTALLLSFAVTSTVNWNHGSTGVMRYAAWIYAFVLVFVAANLEQVRNGVVRTCALAVVVLAAMVQSCFQANDSLAFRDVVRFVWDRCPALYSPDHDVFMSRVTGREYAGTVGMNDAEAFGVYYDDEMNVRKVLATFDGLMAALDRLVVLDRRRFDVAVRDAWLKPSRLRYFDFPSGVLAAAPLEPGRTVGLGEGTLSVDLRRGFGAREPWGVWSKSKSCALRVILPKSSRTLRLVVRAQTYRRTRRVDVYSGERKLARWDVTVPPVCPANYVVDIPPELSGRCLELRLEQDAVASPWELEPGSRDARMLGIGLISVCLVGEQMKCGIMP